MDGPNCLCNIVTHYIETDYIVTDYIVNGYIKTD